MGNRVGVILVAFVDVALLDLVSGLDVSAGASVSPLSKASLLIAMLVVTGGLLLVSSGDPRVAAAFDAPAPERRRDALLWALHPICVLLLAALSIHAFRQDAHSVVASVSAGCLVFVVLIFLSLPLTLLVPAGASGVLAIVLTSAAFLAVGASLTLAAANMMLLWDVARFWTLPLVTLILKCCGTHASVDVARALIACHGFRVRINPSCSGLEGVAILWLFLGTHLLVARDRLDVRRAALVVLPAGTILVWVLNAVRIAAIVGLGAVGYPRLAAGGFHSHAGWLLSSMAIILLIVLIEKGFATETAMVHAARAEPVATDAYLVPQLVILATGLLAKMVSPWPEGLYPVQIALAAIALVLTRSGHRERWCAPDRTVLGMGVLAYAIWMVLELGRGPSGAPPGVARGLLSWGWTAIRVSGSVVVIPLVEELAFRGFLMRRLLRREFDHVSYAHCRPWCVLVSAAVFGFMHSRILAGVGAGIIYGYVARRRGRLADAVVAHALTNALLAATVLATGRASLW